MTSRRSGRWVHALGLHNMDKHCRGFTRDLILGLVLGTRAI